MAAAPDRQDRFETRMPDIVEVKTRRQWRQFIDLPWRIYRDMPHWVPPLRTTVRRTLDARRNPFFRHAELLPLLAVDRGRPVGRAAGVIDAAHNRFHDERTAFFGFFESENRPDVCAGLLDRIAVWSARRGMDRLRGPLNPSTNHECGLLIEGFDKDPRIMMTYNPPYYAALFEQYGLKKAKDLTAWDLQADSPFSNRLIKVSERQKRRAKIGVRGIDKRAFDREIDVVLDIYNDAWHRNWGFVPMTESEFRHMAKEMKLILDPELCLIVEVDGKPAAFGLALPNINQALKKVPSGRLLGTGLFRILWDVLGPGRAATITESRILALGIKHDFRNLGLGPLLFVEYLRRSPARGITTAEASWILEDNREMVDRLRAMSARLTRRYRIYEKACSIAE